MEDREREKERSRLREGERRSLGENLKWHRLRNDCWKRHPSIMNK
jgi:hypothetical protein